MNFLQRAASAAVTTACAFLFSGGANAAVVADGSFEIQGAAVGSACSLEGNGRQCALGAWTGGGAQSGFNIGDGQNFAGVPEDGAYFAFMQSNNGSTSSISQSVTLAGGEYVVSWFAGGRTNYSGAANYTVSLGSQIFSGVTTQAQPFTATSATATLAAGTYDLTFSTHTASGDNSTLIDNVSITAVPEPTSWALIIGGLGLVGANLRRGRKVAQALV